VIGSCHSTIQDIIDNVEGKQPAEFNRMTMTEALQKSF